MHDHLNKICRHTHTPTHIKSYILCHFVFPFKVIIHNLQGICTKVYCSLDVCRTCHKRAVFMNIGNIKLQNWRFEDAFIIYPFEEHIFFKPSTQYLHQHLHYYCIIVLIVFFFVIFKGKNRLQ